MVSWLCVRAAVSDTTQWQALPIEGLPIAGYIFGGVAEVIGWRACFYIEALLGVPLVLISVFVPDVKLRTKQSLAKHEGIPISHPLKYVHV